VTVEDNKYIDEDGRFVLQMKAADTSIAQQIRDLLLTKGGDVFAQMGVPLDMLGNRRNVEEAERLLFKNLHVLPPELQSAIRLGHAPGIALVVKDDPTQNSLLGELWVAVLTRTEHEYTYGSIHTWVPRWKLTNVAGGRLTWEEVAAARGMVYMNSKAPGYENRIEWA
jgi:hypothetical protein